MLSVFGKEQYICWGGRTAVQADLATHVPTGEGDGLVITTTRKQHEQAMSKRAIVAE